VAVVMVRLVFGVRCGWSGNGAGRGTAARFVCGEQGPERGGRNRNATGAPPRATKRR
jgi:hypothetical protein